MDECVPGPLPAGFLWGVSSSAFQSEGGDVDSNWARYMARDPALERSGTSVDFRHRYAEDIALARGLGVNTFRMGIDWARVQPERGRFDESELRYYDDVLSTLRAHAIAPLITLDHWTHPGWVFEQGGWVNERTGDDFLAFVRLVVTRYATQNERWITFNEAFFNTVMETLRRRLTPAKSVRMNRNLVRAHRAAYDLIHQIDPSALVSANIVWFGDEGLARAVQVLSDTMFLDRVADKLDYFAFDYYYKWSKPLDFIRVARRPWLLEIDPHGIYRALKTLSARYPHLPLLIAENGMPTNNDLPRSDGRTRARTLSETVYWVQRAVAENIPVMGYLYWSLTDNYEWGGYAPRFGLYRVDVATDPALTRHPTDAADAYREIIAARGVRR